MAFNYTGGSIVAGSTITFPTHRKGDVILLLAVNYGSATVPSVSPEKLTYATETSSSVPNHGLRFCVIPAASNTETCGTWSNTTHLACAVYRPTAFVGICKLLSSNSVASLAALQTSAGAASIAAINFTGSPSTPGILTSVVMLHSVAEEPSTVAPSGYTLRSQLFSPSLGTFTIADAENITASPSGSQTMITSGTSILRTRFQVLMMECLVNFPNILPRNSFTQDVVQ